MGIRPIDMQISIATMNVNNQAHQNVNKAGVVAHNNVENIKKEQVQNKETVKDPKDSRKIKSVKEEEEDRYKKHKDKKDMDDSSKDKEKIHIPLRL